MKADFQNTYAALPDPLFVRQAPVPVAQPKGLALNEDLADALGISFDDDWADVVAGNRIPEGADPITQAYAGHQFGHWNPQLGDGRAVLLGEVAGFDIQLKGSGRTPWSRGGDGRAWIGPVLREFIVSEAMHALGVPTTRALAMVETGEKILRDDGLLPGAVLARVAPSHIRVGTFQYFAARQDLDSLAALFEHTADRHFDGTRDPGTVLQAAVERQAALVAQWMGLGFIHGVMNTDNAHVAGITIDYGPCAFMDAFHPMKVFSSIDHGSRYAFANQPGIAAWNMAQFATALLPLMDDRDAAIAQFTDIVHGFSDLFEAAYRQVFCAKLGVANTPDADGLIAQALDMMAEQGADFTTTFAQAKTGFDDTALANHPDFAAWSKATADLATTVPINPQVIPRNHLVQQAIDAAVAGDLAPFHALWQAGKTPFKRPDDPALTAPPRPQDLVQRTFCGT